MLPFFMAAAFGSSALRTKPAYCFSLTGDFAPVCTVPWLQSRPKAKECLIIFTVPNY